MLGLTAVPGAGDTFLAAADDRTVRQIAEQRQARRRAASFANSRGRATLETLMEQLKEGEKTSLNLVLKGDVSGSVEALEDALFNLDIPEEVQLKVIDRGVGAITESDVMLASASSEAVTIIGFNVRAANKVREMADREGVEIRYYTVIYQAIEEIEAALKGLLKPEYEEVELGTRGDPRRLPLVQDRQHLRLYRPVGHHPPQRQGAAAAGRGGRGGQSHDQLAQAVQGRRDGGPRGLRVWSDPGRLQQRPGRRRHRNLRDAGEAARLIRG